MDPVTPDRILKELQQLWIDIGKSAVEPTTPEDVKGEHGILRACAMTLILAADEEEEPADISETIAELMHHHPSRAIVLRVRDGDDEFLESRVFAQCWMPFGRRQQICCEQIEIRTSEASLRDVPRIVLGLMAPDLPVVLVCRSAAWFAAPSFAPLLQIVHRVILDTRRSSQPLATMQQIVAARTKGMRATDLAWTAVTEWRHHISAAFDEPVVLGNLHRFHKIAISTSDGGAGPEAWYLAAWLRQGLGPRTEVTFVGRAKGEAVQAVELSGDGVSLSLERDGPVIRVVHDTLANSSSFAISSDWELLRDELSIMCDDRVFQDVLSRAIALAAGER